MPRRRTVAPPAALLAALAKQRTSKVTLGYRIPDSLKKEIQILQIKSAYGARGKSRWIEEAINDFLDSNYWRPQVVEISGEGKPGKPDTVSISDETWERVWWAVLQSAEYGATERDTPVHIDLRLGLIVRAAINYRLLRERARQAARRAAPPPHQER